MEHESDNIEVITNYTTALKELGRYKEAIAINFDLVAKMNMFARHLTILAMFISN